MISGEKRVKVVLSLRNELGRKVFISKPFYYNVIVKPFLINQAGDTLSVKFVVRMSPEKLSNLSMKQLLPDEEYSEEFEYDLDECYDLTEKGIYQLQFVYFGRIYDERNRPLYSMVDVLSNKFVFEVF